MSFTPPSGPSYGLRSPYVFAGYQPIVSQRAPTANDRGPLGITWVDVPNQDSYTLVAIVANAAVWVNTGGGAATFSSLTVFPGPTALTGQFTVTSGAGLPVSIGADATDHDVTIGSQTGVSALVLQSGTGDISLSPADAGDIFIGTASQTAPITLGRSTAGQSISIGGAINTVAQSISLGAGASGANSTVNVLSGVATAGTQTFNVLTGAASTAGAANIATGTAAHVTKLGSVTGAAKTTIQSGTLSMDLTMAAPVAGAGGILVTQGAIPFRILCGAGAPNNNLAINVGDLYINSTGSGVADRMYIATAAGAWTNFTTAA